MAATAPDRAIRRDVGLRALILGLVLGLVAFTGASLVLFNSTGLRVGTTGVVVTLLASLAAGLWAGAPDSAAGEPPPPAARWVLAGLAMALAGCYAIVLTLVPPLAHDPLGRVLGLLLLLAGPGYTLGMLPPLLLAAGERSAESANLPGDGGALGALVLSTLIGVIAGVAIDGLLLVPWLLPGPVLLVGSLVLLLPLALRPPAVAASEETLFAAATPLNDLLVTQAVFPGGRQPERRLYLNGEQESGELLQSGAPTLTYVAAAERWLKASTPPGAHYLFLGGGAHTLPRRVAEADPDASVTVVELDPAVTRAAYDYFGLRPEHRIRTVAADARAFLDRAAEPGTFDRIYVDVYGGREALPYSLLTHEAFSAMARALRPGGVVALNVIGVTDGPEAPRLWSTIRTFTELYPAVALYTHLGPDYPERQNLLLTGALAPDHHFPPRAGLFEPLPRSEWPERGEVVVFRDVSGQRMADGG